MTYFSRVTRDQFEFEFMFASLAVRKFLDKFYPGESTFIDISDYAARIQLDQQDARQVELKVPKVEQVPGGCLHLAISLMQEAHPLAEDRVATIALLGALDIPRPDSVKDKLSGMIQHVYYVIERGYSRTVSQPQVDCEGSPQFFEKLSVDVFQAAESALVEFDQENSMITIKLHRKEPPKPKTSEKPKEKAADKKDGEEEPEAEEEDDTNDELIAFCEFDLWDLVNIERGNQHVELLDRVTRTFDCLTPDNAIRVLSNECHPSMINQHGRNKIRNDKESVDKGSASTKKEGLMSSLMGAVKSAFADKAKEALANAAQAALDEAAETFDFVPPTDDKDDVIATVEEVDKDLVELQSRMFVAKKQIKRTIQSLRQISSESFCKLCNVNFLINFVLGGQIQETCGTVVKKY